ncbi:MAG: hypothetical protein KIT42_09475 [Rhodocyclaceae bacterium]|nr:hypothetical protein [Rhodocyclaceae bacterium]MCB1891834.1 hypothetical protein [Rhodocyclaceae bacterium]MCP5296500.1 hypothetical protein [Zoogloeaceae bacterium]MCW5596085.1 hypothetical protein [Rhodocyclaceae bacterium]
MYIVAIGWLWVVLMMALTEASLTAGILTFLFYGLFPLALFLWLMGTPQRRRAQRPSPRPLPEEGGDGRSRAAHAQSEGLRPLGAARRERSAVMLDEETRQGDRSDAG